MRASVERDEQTREGKGGNRSSFKLVSSSTG
jgi:hypothetical protein